MDAPAHFAEDAWSVAEIPIERLIAPAVVVDVTAKVQDNRDYRLTVEDLNDWERMYGRIPDGAVVFLNSNWASRWWNRTLFLGNDVDDTSDLHFPGFSIEAARWLYEERVIYALGIDTPSLDHGPSQDYPVHVYLLGRNIYFLENVNNLDQLPPAGATVYSFPMKIQGGSGGPCRVMAQLPTPPNPPTAAGSRLAAGLSVILISIVLVLSSTH